MTTKTNGKPPYPVRKMNTRELVIVGMLGGITMLLGLSGLGFIHLVFMKATILQIPTIIGALVEGPRVGALVGFIFGGFSLYQNIVAPTIMSFAFLNPLVSVLPRILIGPVAYLIYRAIPWRWDIGRLAIASFCGSMFNTIGVLGAIYFLYAAEFAAARDWPLDNVVNLLVGIGIANGVPEALVTAVIATPIVYMVKKSMHR